MLAYLNTISHIFLAHYLTILELLAICPNTEDGDNPSETAKILNKLYYPEVGPH